MNIKDLSTDQILQIIVIKKKIEKLHKAVEKRVEKLQATIDSIAGDGGAPSPFKKKRRMSKAGRAAIAAGAKARWAKIKGTAKASKPAKKKRKVSAAVKAKLSAMAKARWAKVKAEGKKGL